MRSSLRLISASLLLLIALTLTYGNHLENEFFFDDAHTICNNEAITSIDITSFFLDPSTFSSLPANRAYRPLVTTLNAISYNLAGGLDPFWFHIHMFFWYIVLLIVLYFLILTILNKASAHEDNPFFALAATAFYGFHTANAETINYLISISDSFSTLCVVSVIYLYSLDFYRRKYYYLLPLVAGIYTKQTGVTAVPILFLYILFFEEGATTNLKWDVLKPKLFSAFRKSLPAIFVGFNLFLFNQIFFTPEETISQNMDVSRFRYFATQLYIVIHYLRNFILPTALSADPDFEIIPGLDLRIISGAVVVLFLLWLAYYSLKRRESAPAGFGILWFFIGLLPTSSFIPLFQIANDHRTFLPYIGLVISVVNWSILLCRKAEARIGMVKKILTAAFLMILAGHAYGVHQRNEVWDNSESLWLDVTIKSPGNGRGLMNYALTQMAEGDFQKTEEYLNKAMISLPNYSYLHINFGILKNVQGQNKESEYYFRKALSLDPANPECYYYYARWLISQGREGEAVPLVKSGLQLSSNHIQLKSLHESLSAMPASQPGKAVVVTELDKKVTSYINLSLELYRKGDYMACVEATEAALAIDPDNAFALNNQCSAYNQLKMWEKALEACDKALAIDPAFELARNNRNWALSGLKSAEH